MDQLSSNPKRAPRAHTGHMCIANNYSNFVSESSRQLRDLIQVVSCQHTANYITHFRFHHKYKRQVISSAVTTADPQ